MARAGLLLPAAVFDQEDGREGAPPAGTGGLGSHGRFVGRSASTDERCRLRFARKRTGAAVLGDKALHGCNAWATGGDSGRVAVLAVPGKADSAHFGGLQQCGRQWVCAVCAAKLANRRAAEVQRGIDAWRAEGGDVLLVTVTMRHAIGDALADELAALKAANRKLAQHRAWKRAMVGEAGMVGRITSTEITRGAAGWHAHQHMLAFVKAGTDREALQAALSPAWAACIKAAGFSAAVDVGLRVDGGHRAGAYVAKLGAGGDWSEADELVRAGSKRGRKGSATFWDLLDVAGDKNATEAQRSRARVLAIEYAEATHGLASLSWSPGLRARLDLEAEASDAELVSQQEGDAELVSLIDPFDWQAVREAGAQPDVLAAANRGGQRAVAELLQSLRAAGPPPERRELIQTG